MGPAHQGHRLVVGDDLGIVRCIDKLGMKSWDTAAEVSRHGDMDKKLGVRCLAGWAQNWGGHEGTWCAAGTVAGTVSLFQGPAMIPRATLAASEHAAAPVSPITDLLWTQQQPTSSSSAPPTLLSTHRAGIIRMHRQAEACTEATCPWEETTTIQTNTVIDCCAISADQSLLAVGGEGSELTTWDLAKGKMASKLKCGKPHPQTRLVDLPWVSCMAWMPGEKSRCVVTGTGYHKVRVYDVEAQKRPIFEVNWLDARITAVAAQLDGNYVWAANAKGHIQVLDVRMRRMMDALKGQIAGSIRSLDMHPEEPLLCSAGLDRWVRVHDTKSRKCLSKIYLKSQLTACCWLPGALEVLPDEAPVAEEGPAKRVWRDSDFGGKKSKRARRDEDDE